MPVLDVEQETTQERYACMLRLPTTKANEIKRLAAKYSISYNAMVNILIAEALAAREK